jgi:hypothetical protein
MSRALTHPSSPRRPHRLRRALVGAVTALATTAGVLAAAPAQADNKPTPRHFTGYGFDQCVAPTQGAMDRWLEYSPFLAVGIYISGRSRGCRSQPNLTPAWVSTQLRRGWRLLPITLGPQAACHPSFPRYGNDPVIDDRPGDTGRYPYARRQGRAEARSAVAAARDLGIVPRSTLWYDLEGFDVTRTRCRESALAFLSGWSFKVRKLGYVSGVYSSAGSGIKMLDDARVRRPRAFSLPDRIWIARWDGVANTSTSYIRDDGWRPGGRMKQYRGDHRETWGGVTINIDSNWLDLGRGSVPRPENRCDGTRIDFRKYLTLRSGVSRPLQTKALQCLLREKGFWGGAIHGVYGPRVVAAAQEWRASVGLNRGTVFRPRHWQMLHAQGSRLTLKTGSAGRTVRRAQRALNTNGARLVVTGAWNPATRAALRDWQGQASVPVTGILGATSWQALQRGRR